MRKALRKHLCLTDFSAMSRHTLRLIASPVRAYDMLSPGRDARPAQRQIRQACKWASWIDYHSLLTPASVTRQARRLSPGSIGPTWLLGTPAHQTGGCVYLQPASWLQA